MNKLVIAREFFSSCESGGGWQECSQYVVEDAEFSGQSNALAEVATVREYCDWMMDQAKNTFPTATFDECACALDIDRNIVLIFGTFHATHLGPGGPVPPTKKTSVSEYVYVLHMNSEDKISKMIKVWNSEWSAERLGWQ